MPPEAVITHATPGRTRIRVMSHQRDAAFFARAEAVLGQLKGVERVKANPLTGSILVLHHPGLSEIARFGESTGLFRLAGHAPAGVPVATQVYQQVRGANRVASALTGGRVDLGSLGFVVLIGLAMYQAHRGQLLGPATTLFFQAVTALSLSDKRSAT